MDVMTMEKSAAKQITVEVIVNTPTNIVWKKWTNPKEILKWNNNNFKKYVESF